MAGYAIQVRLDGVRPRRAGTSAVGRDRPAMDDEGQQAEPIGMLDVEPASTAPSPAAERWLRFHELWQQTTFFLFDGDSWRR